jgi:hypothetical protein
LRAWIKASAELVELGDEAYNVIIDVENALNHDKNDHEIISLVDSFLRSHGSNQSNRHG